MTFHDCSSPTPTLVKPQPAPAYLAKSQSTPRCQSLITPGSNHQPVLEAHMVLTIGYEHKYFNIISKNTLEFDVYLSLELFMVSGPLELKANNP
jgi:hypothetical protein